MSRPCGIAHNHVGSTQLQEATGAAVSVCPRQGSVKSQRQSNGHAAKPPLKKGQKLQGLGVPDLFANRMNDNPRAVSSKLLSPLRGTLTSTDVPGHVGFFVRLGAVEAFTGWQDKLQIPITTIPTGIRRDNGPPFSG